MLKGKNIVVGVTGGIAAYKACELVSRLKKQGAQVRVVLTEHAAGFVPPLTFETLSAQPVCTDCFERRNEIEHISLAKWADLLIVAPATANCLAKARAGICDDLLTTTLCAVSCPVLFAPAMNAQMWRNPATRENLKTLRARGMRFVGPESGHLACGDDDIGRMSEPEDIVRAAEEILFPKEDLKGLKVLVTAGPTVERIDPVRYITNRSSGKMGFALAEAAAARGADVTLISGPVSLDTPAGAERISVISSAELCEAVLSHAKDSDIVLQAAAPADFTPETTAEQKIKKTGEDMILHLVSTRDIAKTLGENKREGQTLVAFAAETENMIEHAKDKLLRKNADLIVANDVSASDAGFASDNNRVVLITRGGQKALPLMSKREVADAVLDEVLLLRERA